MAAGACSVGLHADAIPDLQVLPGGGELRGTRSCFSLLDVHYRIQFGSGMIVTRDSNVHTSVQFCVLHVITRRSWQTRLRYLYSALHDKRRVILYTTTCLPAPFAGLSSGV